MNRVIGPVQGVSNMIDEDRYCVDILVQIQAARSALHQVSMQRQAVDAEQKNATPMNQRELRLNENGSGGRTRTPLRLSIELNRTTAQPCKVTAQQDVYTCRPRPLVALPHTSETQL